MNLLEAMTTVMETREPSIDYLLQHAMTKLDDEPGMGYDEITFFMGWMAKDRARITRVVTEDLKSLLKELKGS